MLRETGDHMPESSRRCRTRPPTKGEEVPRGGQLCNCNPVWAKSYTVGCIMLGNKTGGRYQRSGASGVSQRVFGDSSSPSLVSSGKETEFLAARMAERVGEELEDRFPEHAQEMRTADHRAQACRLGRSPFSAATVNVDFCAHRHRDTNNKETGLSALLTVLPPGEQPGCYHQLPTVSPEGHQSAGVSIALPNGSLMFEAARAFSHQTTPVVSPSSRLSVVFYQHRLLDRPLHGAALGECFFYYDGKQTIDMHFPFPYAAV